jgi:hypothetical protein
MSFCRWPSETVEGVQSCSAKSQGEGRVSAFRTLVFLPVYLFHFCSLPFFAPSFLLCLGTGKEEGREGLVGHKDVGVRKGNCQL